LRIVAQGGAPPRAEGLRIMELQAVGQDHPGIVRDISRVLSRHDVNIEELTTDRLRRELETIANDLMVDLTLVQAVIRPSAR